MRAAPARRLRGGSGGSARNARGLAVTLALAAGLVAAPLRAETGPEQEAYRIGACIAKQRDAASALIRALPLDAGSTSLEPAELGAAASCVKQPIALRTRLLRGAIAQAMLLRDFPRFGVPPEISQKLFVRLDLPLAPRPGVDAGTADLYKLADCVIRNRPIDSESLFRSSPGSVLERRILDGLTPIVAACRPQRATTLITRGDFRSVLAQAAYDVSVRYWSEQLWSAK
jgi:hypothetical protein